MIEFDLNRLKDVGKISHEALEYSKTLVKPGAKIYDICEKLEDFMRSKDMLLAFPVNISVNQQAAHYTAAINDPAVLTENDLVKVDLGARKGTMLGDCAITIDLSGKYSQLVETAQETLEAALSKVKAGAPLNSVGKEVEEICKKKSLQPIKNLGGHAIEETELHASIFIPNFDNGDTTKLQEGQVIAVETFITDGVGYVLDSDNVQIFQMNSEVNPRSEEARTIEAKISNDYKTYPFALRWLSKELDSEFKIRKAINEINTFGVIDSFPTLIEKGNGMVAQAEHEVLVEKDSCTILTK